MPQMTLTADEAKMIRAHRKDGEARKWFMVGVAACVRLIESAAADYMATDAVVLRALAARVRAIEPPRDIG